VTRTVTHRGPYTKTLTVYLTPAMYGELTAEAWECERALSDYVRGLLSRRGKWSRTVGSAGGYDLQAPPPPPIGTRGPP
jgi:hypothetical protein